MATITTTANARRVSIGRVVERLNPKHRSLFEFLQADLMRAGADADEATRRAREAVIEFDPNAYTQTDIGAIVSERGKPWSMLFSSAMSAIKTRLENHKAAKTARKGATG